MSVLPLILLPPTRLAVEFSDLSLLPDRNVSEDIALLREPLYRLLQLLNFIGCVAILDSDCQLEPLKLHETLVNWCRWGPRWWCSGADSPAIPLLVGGCPLTAASTWPPEELAPAELSPAALCSAASA